MATLIEQLIGKMGLHDEANVLDKTTELVRLLDLRSTNAPLQINEYGKIVLCAEIASTLLGIGIDTEQALKLSGLRKSHYANNKRMIEKLLDLNKIVGVHEICTKLCINEVATKADELLQLYKKVIANENADIDIVHPQYAAMAVFYACKIMKKRITKPKIMPFSNLRPTQWMQLEQRWDKFIEKHYKQAMDNKLKKQNSNVLMDGKCDSEEKRTSDKSAGQRLKVEMEDYEKWKKRMLKMAENKLKLEEEQGKDEDREKENMILGI